MGRQFAEYVAKSGVTTWQLKGQIKFNETAFKEIYTPSTEPNPQKSDGNREKRPIWTRLSYCGYGSDNSARNKCIFKSLSELI